MIIKTLKVRVGQDSESYVYGKGNTERNVFGHQDYELTSVLDRRLKGKGTVTLSTSKLPGFTRVILKDDGYGNFQVTNGVAKDARFCRTGIMRNIGSKHVDSNGTIKLYVKLAKA